MLQEALRIVAAPRPPGPVEQVGGCVGEGAHVPRADVEQVTLVVGAVGDAASDDPAGFVDHDFQRRVVRAHEQVDRRQHATGAATDHRDPGARARAGRCRRTEGLRSRHSTNHTG